MPFYYFYGDKMTAETSKRGGARHGAGRKPTGRLKIFKTISISGTPEEIERLKALAETSGKSFSRFVIDTLLSS